MSQVIPEAAVEAAVKAAANVPSYCHDDPEEIRKVLEAAAPYIAEAAWNLGFTSGLRCERGQVIANPYRPTK